MTTPCLKHDGICSSSQMRFMTWHNQFTNAGPANFKCSGLRLSGPPAHLDFKHFRACSTSSTSSGVFSTSSLSSYYDAHSISRTFRTTSLRQQFEDTCDFPCASKWLAQMDVRASWSETRFPFTKSFSGTCLPALPDWNRCGYFSRNISSRFCMRRLSVLPLFWFR